ncbi:uncharacterized protein LOC131183891 [Ahaetulla prasina]|uniref:uncharacterized protein LOC131183891 n=1 Tax=Ahaetulla prasina TaxID=499056 RepID=UPI00264891FC|nr:uncharacterized protein LOC131183891 [Ahaetulla prasina]
MGSQGESEQPLTPAGRALPGLETPRREGSWPPPPPPPGSPGAQERRGGGPATPRPKAGPRDRQAGLANAEAGGRSPPPRLANFPGKGRLCPARRAPPFSSPASLARPPSVGAAASCPGRARGASPWPAPSVSRVGAAGPEAFQVAGSSEGFENFGGRVAGGWPKWTLKLDPAREPSPTRMNEFKWNYKEKLSQEVNQLQTRVE